MIYKSGDDWRNSAQKRVLLFGMAGLGKTHISNMLRASGDWFHYSVDYRIATHYMGDFIADNLKREAMERPFLAEQLRTGSICITPNTTFNDLTPLASYLGRPGDSAKGGLAMADYAARQQQHHEAEVAALGDAAHFIRRARTIYGHDNFVCDSGGSICEVVDPFDPDDPVLRALSENLLLVCIRGSDALSDTLKKRFDATPKPMCYRADFLTRVWGDYLSKNNVLEGDVDPQSFARWAFSQALDYRAPRYAAMAHNRGITLSATDIAKVTTPKAFEDLIARALEKHVARP
ncbi:MAG: ATPase [Paracoccaceae bacterium]